MALESLYLTRDGYKKSVIEKKGSESDNKVLMRKNFENRYLDPNDISIGHS